MLRNIIIYKNHFLDFYRKQDLKTQTKIEYVLDLIRFEQHVPKKLYKLLKNTDGIWEIRVITSLNSICILCFQEKGNIVVLVNSFIKKTQKTPKSEIRMAEKLKKEYFKEKQRQHNKMTMKDITNFEDLLISKYGEKGTLTRDLYDTDSLSFRLGVMLKKARKEAQLTQEELATKTGTKKSYISRIERGESDIQVSTYQHLVEIGLGRCLNISIE
ncbi:MAG: type II toxin-antitoxin system RelE/ParE family toxin [Bacteroidales bacterium]